jgi:catechol 2,3-dioxygenase-like lactoylglutathione lyase family enzyme
MQATIGHVQFNVRQSSLPFYRDLMAFLGWQTLYDVDEMLGVSTAEGSSLWFSAYAVKEVSNDYDGPGMNHFAFGATSQADVDEIASHLRERGVALLFDTPRHRPEFAESEAHTYYQVMFESPDRILFEVVYTGLKTS